MTLKIFRNSFLIGLIVLLLCAAMFFGVLYGFYEKRVFSELAAETDYVGRGVECAGADYFQGLNSDERVTWVAADGTVLYDTRSDAAAMENHLDREEIAEALKTGTGQSSHMSRTLFEKTLYYAERISDGTVVRVSATQSTVAAMLLTMLQPLLWLIALSLILCALLSSRLARQITRPINELDLDHPERCESYPELSLLIGRIREQNYTIRRQMDELGRRQRAFEAVTENMREGFLLLDGRSDILSANRSALALAVLPDRKEPARLSRADCRPEIVDAADAALAGQRSEGLLRRDDESWQVIASPVAADGQVSGAVVLLMDVTEREQREALRQEFSANVSHELKTPLTSISGFAELMMDGLVAPEKTAEFAGDIYHESRRLIGLVDDILRLSRMDEGQPMEREDVDLFALAADVVENLRPAAAAKNVALSAEGGAAVVNGVWQVLNEMVYNLCDNAVKYNREGGSVTVTVSDTDEGVVLAVADTGIGIPEAEQKRVFERFYRVDKSHSKAVGGTGLGLSIVKHGAQMHGARLELESTCGVGSTFRLIFPRKKEES